MTEDEKYIEIDHENLRGMLYKLVAELDVPFLERRGRANTHKTQPLEELSEVIKEVSERERDLKAVAGIASILIKNNEALRHSFSRQTEKLGKKETRITELEGKISKLRRSSSMVEAELSQKLILVERESEDLRGKIQKMQKESPTKFELPTSDDTSEDEGTQDLKFELQQAKSEISDLETELERVYEKYSQAKKTLKSNTNKIQTLESRLNHSQQRINELEDEKESLYVSLQKYKENLHRLKTVKTVNKHTRMFSQCVVEIKDENSLKSELEFERILSLCTQNKVAVRPSYTRKSPEEEHFKLTAQEVKLNSKYMDAICTVSTSELYLRAMKEQVPLHHWHAWIEQQLNHEYIKKLYAGKKKRKMKKNKVLPFDEIIFP